MHFNKSPHASEHIYYPFSGTVEPGEIGAAESTGALLGNEPGGCGLGAGGGATQGRVWERGQPEIYPWRGYCRASQSVNAY